MPTEAAPAFFSTRPPPPLDAFVEAIWAVRGASGYTRFTMLPNNAVQLMLNFGSAHRVTCVNGRRCDRPFARGWIAGLQDQPLSIESPPSSNLVAIRFGPGGAHAFLPLPLQALTNDVVDAADVLGAALAELHECLALARGWRAQVDCVQHWLLARLQPREHDFHLVTRAIDALAPAQGRSVRSICDGLGLTNKHMISVFRRLTGLPPKTLARVQRFHDTLVVLGNDAQSHGAIALAAGYYDQAHFNRDFKRFAGVSPTQFVARRGADGESLIDG